MHYKKEDAAPFEIPGGTSGILFPSHPQNEHSVAIVEIDGVYPLKGYSLNDFCTETFYILEGDLNIEVGGKLSTVKTGELFLVLPKKSYKIKGKAKACILITPAWQKDQNHIIEE